MPAESWGVQQKALSRQSQKQSRYLVEHWDGGSAPATTRDRQHPLQNGSPHCWQAYCHRNKEKRALHPVQCVTVMEGKKHSSTSINGLTQGARVHPYPDHFAQARAVCPIRNPTDLSSLTTPSATILYLPSTDLISHQQPSVTINKALNNC